MTPAIPETTSEITIEIFNPSVNQEKKTDGKIDNKYTFKFNVVILNEKYLVVIMTRLAYNITMEV